MTRRLFLTLAAVLALSSLTIQAGSVPARAKLGMVITQNDVASQVGLQRHQERRQRHRRRRRDRLRAGGHASHRRQHRRRRLHRLPADHRRAGVVRFPRSRPRAIVAGDVAEGRQVRLRDPSQQPPLGRRARHRRRPLPGVEGPGLEALERTGDAGHRPGPRRLRDHPRAGLVARADDPGIQEVPGLARAVLQERPAVSSRRDSQAA